MMSWPILVGDGVGEDLEPFRNNPFTFMTGGVTAAGLDDDDDDEALLEEEGATMTTAAAAVLREVEAELGGDMVKRKRRSRKKSIKLKWMSC